MTDILEKPKLTGRALMIAVAMENGAKMYRAKGSFVLTSGESTSKAIYEKLRNAKLIKSDGSFWVYAAPGELDSVYDAELDAISARLAEGDTLKEFGWTGYGWKSEGHSSLFVTSRHIADLVRQKRALHECGIVVFTSPDIQAAKEQDTQKRRQENKRARLDRWRQVIQITCDTDGIFNGTELDAVLEAIAGEAMSLGSLED
jgi:hypothetical protein